MIFFYMSLYTPEATTIWYTLLHSIFIDKKDNLNEEIKDKKMAKKNVMNLMKKKKKKK